MQAVAEEKPIAAVASPKPYTAPAREVWGWGIGRIAEFGLIATFGQAMTIFTVGFGLSPVIVSWCMMLPRLVDGLVDPIIGHWSDETHTRWGRRKPFLIGGAFLGAFFLAILWWAGPDWSPTAQFLYLGFVGMALYLCYGAYAMAWNAVGYELSDDYHERSKVAAIGGFFLAGMGLLLSWMYWLALRPMFGNVIWGMRWIGIGMAVLIVISAVVTTLMIKERFTHTNRTHVPLLPALKATLKNRPFVVLLLMKVFEIFGGRPVGGVAFYLGVYYVCRGDQDLWTRLSGIGATLGTVWSFAVLPFVKPVSKLIGKRGALIAGAALSFTAAIAAPFVTTPEHPYWSMIPGLVIAPLLVISSTIAGAILPDICDVDELQSGQRREGLFTSVMGFVSKLEISLAVVLVGYVVSWSSVDTAIGRRWEGVIDGKDAAVTKFASGETAVFGFNAGRSATFDTFAIDTPHLGEVREVELFASDESPTLGFRSIGRFRADNTNGRHEFKFSAVAATYVKVRLMSTDASALISLSEIRVTNSTVPSSVTTIPDAAPMPNLIASDGGGRVLAAAPPEPIVNRLYWLVMTPGIVFTGLTLLATICFPLTEGQMMEVRRRLDEMHLAKAAAGVPTDEVAETFVLEHPDVVENVRSAGGPRTAR